MSTHLFDILQNRFVKEVFIDNEYPMAEGIVVDIGALNGEFCLYNYAHATKIIAVEPLDNAKELQEKVREYRLEKMSVYHVALSDHVGTVYMNNFIDNGGSLVVMNETKFMVPCITLNKLMELENIDHIDFLKIDIEGYEHSIFNDPDFPWDKVKAICGEHLSSDTMNHHGFFLSPKHRQYFVHN
jgi:FkbM family methyltransferase